MADQDILIPDPLSSLQEAERFYGIDVPSLEDSELLEEHDFLKAHLWGLPPVCWPRERCILLEQEIKRRGNSRKTEYSPITRQKPKKVEGIKI